jgi:hypothetical protein
MATEHAPCAHRAERRQQLQAMVDQGGAHAVSLGRHNARFDAGTADDP